MGKRGPRTRPPVRLATTDDLHELQVSTPERPPGPWDRIVLTEEQAAEFLNRSRTWVRDKAREGKIPRYADGGEYHYYVYDLLDYTLRASGE